VREILSEEKQEVVFGHNRETLSITVSLCSAPNYSERLQSKESSSSGASRREAFLVL
jgi:hypothetical protein